jgi:hypothetical protein
MSEDEDKTEKWIRLRMDLIARVLGRQPTRAELVEYLLPELAEMFGATAAEKLRDEKAGQTDRTKHV